MLAARTSICHTLSELQGGKLVFWACKQAAYEARQAVARHWQRWQGNKRHSARAEPPQYRSLMDELLSSTGMDLQHELEFQEERHKIMAYANADWKVCKLPSLPKTGRFAWPWRRKRGKPTANCTQFSSLWPTRRACSTCYSQRLSCEIRSIGHHY